MPDDAGAHSAVPVTEVDAAAKDRRGPLRPERLQSARARLSGAAIVRFFQLGDVMGLIAASLIATWAAPEAGGQPFVLAAPFLAVITLLATKAYRMSIRESGLDRLGRAVLSAAAAGGGASALLAFALPKATGSIVAGVWTAAAAVILTGLHLAWYAVLKELRHRGLLTPNVVVVGATPAAAHLIRRALKTRELNILGVFDDRRERAGPAVGGVPVLGTTRDLVGHRVLPYVDRIVISVPKAASARVAQLLEHLAPIPNPISLLMDGDDADAEAEAVNRIADFALQQISGAPSRGSQAAKRALDLVLASLGLLALAPLMGLVAMAIKLDSPGPAIFRQRRHGYMNEEIVVWKFRSMRTDRQDLTASRQVTADDDRVTRVGRFIRRTSLDELPQLFNVIRGEMSLVGPRPHAIGMLTGGAEASKLVETYAHRHRIKPGLTGWSAVNGSRGPVDTPEAVRRRVALDLEYVERQSIWLDLAIILKTAPCLLGDVDGVR
jgi:polysaccharide biosynthesis protein PslA